MATVDEYFQIQLINENGVLDDKAIETFEKQGKLAKSGISYAVVSIIGPQSGGKSTLLNHLFGTKFRELDASVGRGQTTKGIWLAKCADIERCTLVMDVEGTDGRERGEDGTAFEKRTALFALAVSNIMIINMWCNDIGREQAANRPLLRTVFEVMCKLLGFRKMTLLFVIRDKTKSPMNVLEKDLKKDIRQIWNSFEKPDGQKGTPLDKFFNVEIVALSHYEHKEDQFKEEVASLRQRFFSPAALGKFAGDVPTSGFFCGVQKIWKAIRENKDLDLPTHKVMVATTRCEQIAKEKLESLDANEDWLKLCKDVQSHRVPQFGKKLSSILDSRLSEYDAEAKYFDEGVRTEKRRQLKNQILQLVKPAYKRMLEHIQSQILKQFNEACQKILNGSEEFYMAAQDCIRSFMTQYDEGCKEAIVKQADWDSSKQREKLQNDMDSHVAKISSSKVLELVTQHKAKLKAELSGQVESLLDKAVDGTWQAIREYYERQTQSAISEIYNAVSGFKMDQDTYDKIVLQLKDSARRLIRKKAEQAAAKVLICMNLRFERDFSRDSESKLRVWSGKEDVEAIRETAYSSSLKLLSIMAAIRLGDKADDIEKTLFLAFLSKDESTKNTVPLASHNWKEVPSSDTLITPINCKDIWKEFRENSEAIITAAQA